MPRPTEIQFANAWLDFISSTQILLNVDHGDRPLDQYDEFRNQVIALVIHDNFITTVKDSWIEFDLADIGVASALFEELRAFSRAVGKAQTSGAIPPERPEGGRTTETVAPEARQGWFGWLRGLFGRGGASTAAPERLKDFTGRWLDRASTIAGSVKDLLDNLPWEAKAPITLFKELVDLFKSIGRK